MIGKELGAGISDYLAKAVGFSLTHKLSHGVKDPGGWKNFGTYCRFICEEHGRFLSKLQSTPEPAGEGNMLDHTQVLFGSASSAFHLSRNYPLILAGGKRMGVRQGQYLKYGAVDFEKHFRISKKRFCTAMLPYTEELPLVKTLRDHAAETWP